jgi:hypothetical protein
MLDEHNKVMRERIWVLTIILVTTLCLCGCAQFEKIIPITTISPATPTAFQVHQPSPSFSPEETSIPKTYYLSVESQEQLRELLYTNGGCDLPCFAGITPGKTNWDLAKALLSAINKFGSGLNYIDGNLPAYSMAMEFIDPKKRTIISDISLTVGNDVVQRVNVYVETKDSGEDLNSYWSYYSIRKIINQLGIPDQIFVSINRDIEVDPRYVILILYKDKKAAFWLDGNRQKDVAICPEMESRYQIDHLRISLANPSANIDLLPPDWIPITDTEFWQPIKDVLGVSEKEFYERLLADKSACFTVVKPR